MLSKNSIKKSSRLAKHPSNEIGGYSREIYADLEVIVMNHNGYMNATKMLRDINKITGEKKSFINWKATDESKYLINEVCMWEISDDNEDCTASTLFITNNDNNVNEINGTYVHPLLIPAIASWASPKIAFRISIIVNNFFIIDGNTNKVSNHKLNSQLLTSQTNTVILRERRSESEKNTKQISKILKRSKIILELTNDIYNRNVIMNGTLDNAIKYQATPTNINIIVIIKPNTRKTKHVPKPPDYYVMNTMQNIFRSQWKDYKQRNPRAEIIYALDNSPNVNKLWKNIIRNHIDINDITVTGKNIYLGENYSGRKFIRTVTRVHQKNTNRY
jgi:hypothetical protein